MRKRLDSGGLWIVLVGLAIGGVVEDSSECIRRRFVAGGLTEPFMLRCIHCIDATLRVSVRCSARDRLKELERYRNSIIELLSPYRVPRECQCLVVIVCWYM